MNTLYFKEVELEEVNSYTDVLDLRLDLVLE